MRTTARLALALAVIASAAARGSAAVPRAAGPLFGVHSQAAAAFDGTDRPQIMVGETGIGGFGFGVNPHPPHIYVYRLLGSAADPHAWERTMIDTLGTHEAQAVDLDGDGLPT